MIYGMQITSSSSSFSKPFIIPLKSDLKAFHDATIVESDIDHCKELANPEKYFKLFSKHLKKFENEGLGKRIALIDISNLGVDKKIIDLNPKAEYILVDNFLDYEMLKAVCPNADISLICTDENGVLDQLEKLQKLNINMKFDVVVGNPPYDGVLHLKILKKVSEFVDLKNGGEIIWLHPGQWIRRFDYWTAKKYRFKIEDANEVKPDEAQKLFQAGIGSSLIITKISDLGTYDLKKFSKYTDFPWVKEKIIDKAPELLKNCSAKVKSDGHQYQLNLPIIHGHFNCRDWEEITSKKYSVALKVKFGKRPQDINSLAFESENCRKNFYDSLFTKFNRFLIQLCRLGQCSAAAYYAIPFMQDYTKPWTDERFYKYFNLTPNEIKLIEDMIKE